jgi:SAM-dependent methyltransferase
MLAALGSVTGLEPSPEAAAVARSRGAGEVVEGVMEALPFEDSSFDFATSLDVIEHLDDDVAGLRELRRVVRPAGFLVVTVPAYPGLYGPHDVANEHRRRYLRRTLVEAAEEAGWSARLVTHFNSLLFPAIAPYRLMQRRRHRGETQEESDFERSPAWLARALELPLRAEANAVARGVRLPVGLSILAVLERA